MSAGFPRATYRLQLHAGFRFEDACAVAPYIAELGASHLYLSPIFLARPGSQHGYDLLDQTKINPELGGEDGFAALARRCEELGLGIILDFVPNHMGVGGSDNPLWKDVLEWGQASPHADWFDIDWSPGEPTLEGRVLLPFLGRPYGEALASGEIGVAVDAERGELAFSYYEHRFPLAPHSYAPILADTGLDPLVGLANEFAGLSQMAEDPASARARAAELKAALSNALRAPGAMEALEGACHRAAHPQEGARASELHRLLEAQNYRLAFWRVAADEINYRRFFDINGLAGMRMENEAVFQHAHERLLSLLKEHSVQGVRLDHVDGLGDPAGYCRRLQEAARGPLGATDDETQPLYVLVEKIAAPHESLPADWPVAGTTGYDFLNLANGLFVDPEGEAPLTRRYRRFTGREADFEEVLDAAKRQIIRNNLGSELAMIARKMHDIAKASWRTRDFTYAAMRAALIDVLAVFPVYRTYVSEAGPTDQDRRYLDWAIRQAKKSPGLTDESVYDFIASILSASLRPEPGDAFTVQDVSDARRKFEQTSPPVMAKAMEDTSFYRYFRLISLNEVGGEPSRFSISPQAFHVNSQRRLTNQPGALNATATHDHKRGEDTRARINVLSECPAQWTEAVRAWARMNRRLRVTVEEAQAPDRNDEYLFYQTLVGAWPLGMMPDDAGGVAALADRLSDYLLKAAREAKEHTSWAVQRAPYEQAMEGFARGAMDPARSMPFLRSVHAFVRTVAPAGAVNGLAQTVLKLTAPGAPDLYQGTEFWDFSLVDPDNRRPVDYKARRSALTGEPAALATCWRDGRVKLAVIQRLLALRAAAPDLFAQGSYTPVTIAGPGADRALAFERAQGSLRAVTIIPRLVWPFAKGEQLLSVDPAGWADTRLDAELDGGRWVIGGPGANAPDPADLPSIFANFPVAVWTNAPD